MTLPTEPVSRAAALRARMNAKDEPKAKPVVTSRIDWLSEFPCVYRGEMAESVGCGCGGNDLVQIYGCDNWQGGRCVVLASHRSRLLSKHRQIAESMRVCEICESICRASIDTDEICHIES